jgi:hypothetical protein
MYQLDPLHAITARITFYKPAYGDSPKPKKEPVKRYSIYPMAKEIGVKYDTLRAIARKILGKGGFLNQQEYDILVVHMKSVKIRRRMKRVK